MHGPWCGVVEEEEAKEEKEDGSRIIDVLSSVCSLCTFICLSLTFISPPHSLLLCYPPAVLVLLSFLFLVTYYLRNSFALIRSSNRPVRDDQRGFAAFEKIYADIQK